MSDAPITWDPPPVKLGKRPAIHRPDAARLSAHKMASAKPPDRVQRGLTVPWGLDGNDLLSDCTAVALANYWRGCAAIGGYEFDIRPEHSIAFYSASAGYVPGDASTDTGAVESDVLLFQARHGGFVPGSQMPLVALPFDIEVGDQNGLANTIANLAAGYIGVDLPISAQRQEVWDTEGSAADGDPTPGSWGGHAVIAWEYAGLADTDLVTLITWGTEQRATWRWLRKYMDEAHGLSSRLLTAPMGLDVERLAADQPAG